MNARAPKGTADMLPDVARAWEHMQRTAQRLFARYGYEPVYTPIFEHTEVFTRGIGEATDIVSKEMYTFEDKGGRSITLRPEGTASVVRATLEHNLVANGQSAKLYYAGPMFRYERPQKGRMRQFWQIGAEALGMAEPGIDAEVIVMLMRYFEELGIPRQNMRLLINTMGDENCRPAYRDKIAGFIREHSTALCEECNRRAETNPLRAFDCKNPGCKDVMSEAPLLRDELCDDCAAHYAAVKSSLDDLAISYIEDPSLVRGLDYYTRTVFEVQVDAGLGSQNAIGGGGRYDRLMEQYGGPATPGLGFALGFERTLLALEAAGVAILGHPVAEVYVARVDAALGGAVFALVQELRDAGIATETDYQGRSLKSQFKQADRLGARAVVIVGPDELAAGEVTMRDMTTKDESRIPLGEIAARLKQLLG
ncbi:MAG: histidine--tRNA ligase [Actinobacteria bacterium HGW-Actinobacteria-1]|jgi:histidyl-tRNA synthetase|nr:MAG: histidine--tRNA ligase [Actinobacteria bacterium HGW-Actinobacteria-1]